MDISFERMLDNAEDELEFYVNFFHKKQKSIWSQLPFAISLPDKPKLDLEELWEISKGIYIRWPNDAQRPREYFYDRNAFELYCVNSTLEYLGYKKIHLANRKNKTKPDLAIRWVAKHFNDPVSLITIADPVYNSQTNPTVHIRISDSEIDNNEIIYAILDFVISWARSNNVSTIWLRANNNDRDKTRNICAIEKGFKFWEGKVWWLIRDIEI